ncbi:AAA family ATPase, partial [Helicobacter didelphidarum]
TPRFKMEQIQLDKKTRKALQECITLVKKQPLIYDTWGFRQIDSVPKTIINFYGKPGTGKTMSAHIIADELKKKIILSNYADIESKYVGDAPKNLVATFDLAQKHDAILFFDEADSFLGKRITNVSHSADQAINSLRSELLKLLEERAVIVIFATNLLENYDKAFHSRILRSIEFVLPNAKQRKKIIQKTIPTKLYEQGVQFDDTQLDILASLSEGFAGREIKNAVLNALISVANKSESQGAKNVDSEKEHEILPTFKDFKKAFTSFKRGFEVSHADEIRNKNVGSKIHKNLANKNYKVIKEKK